MLVNGIPFRNPLGLAAGFDKNAEFVKTAALLGFGFIEIGTVTLRPQEGNPRPRLFRSPEDKSLINRMGFNNQGASAVSQRLRSQRENLPSDFRVGVNMGLNKETPHERAAEEYASIVPYFEGLADYFVINVSSPNTPSLRELQAEDSLLQIVEAVSKKLTGDTPIFLKLAPEIEGEFLRKIVRSLDQQNLLSGYIVTNTLMVSFQSKSAGKSGAALAEISRARLKEIKAMSQRPVISVGGIMTADEAKTRLSLGATLIQVYSGWVYAGPSFVSSLLRSLS